MIIFSVGNKWRYSGLVKTEKDALGLLALEVYFQATGCRYNLIKKLTIGEVMSSTRMAMECPYCREKTQDDWRRHKKRCRKRRKAKRRGEVGKEEADPWANPNWTMAFRDHKAFRGKVLPVVVDNTIHDLLVKWIRRQHGGDGPDTRLFTGLRWENLLTLLGRIVSRRVLKKAEGNGPIGSKVSKHVYKLCLA